MGHHLPRGVIATAATTRHVMVPGPGDLPTRRERRAAAVAEAWLTGGVLSRHDLRRLGFDRNAVAREVAAGRWQMHGRHTVAVHTGPLGVEASRWRAVWEVSRTRSVADGVTALQAAGLSGYADDMVHLSVPHATTHPPVRGVRVHAVCRRPAWQVIGSGLPRTRPAVAAVRAAQWALSDRQASLLLVMPVQQRLVTGAQLTDAAARVPGRARRALIREVVADIVDGTHALGELDFARLCRRHRIPRPDRQVVRRLPNGTAYLDARWDAARLVVEVDGSGHRQGLAVTADNLRQNDVTLTRDIVLRIDVLGLRVAEEQFMAQVSSALAART